MPAEAQLKERDSKESKAEMQYLTFQLNGEIYGLEILKVREIIEYIEATKVPKTSDYVKGVVNLRGQVVPVIDLRTKFAMPQAEITDQTCIIVVQIGTGDSLMHTGIVVDQVEEVLDINEDDIEQTEQFGNNVNSDFILGIAKTGKSITILLDINKVLSAGEIVDLQK
jgi:purine-binding chemotaxis protein CheW